MTTVVVRCWRHGRDVRRSRTSEPTSIRWTRPCVYSSECPHDRGLGECPAVEHDTASKCPSSVSPHAIRRGSIAYSLTSDMPDKVVSDRANVSQRVIEQHYDRPTEREKMEQRREYLDNLQPKVPGIGCRVNPSIKSTMWDR